MKKYSRPVVLGNEELAESVFNASGTTAGVNVVLGTPTDGEHDTSSHAAEDPHPIRKYPIEIPAYLYGQVLHFSLDCRGPIRHAGFHHQDEATVIRTGNHVEGDFKVSADNKKYIYVCCDYENYPDALDIISVSVTPK